MSSTNQWRIYTLSAGGSLLINTYYIYDSDTLPTGVIDLSSIGGVPGMFIDTTLTQLVKQRSSEGIITNQTTNQGIVLNSNNFKVGTSNTVTGSTSGSILGGTFNTINSTIAAIVTGTSNTINAITQNVAILAGSSHQVNNGADGSAIGSGNGNTINSVSSFVAGGATNTINANTSFIGGGTSNSVTTAGIDSAIVTGANNTLSAGNANCIINGTGNIINGSDNVTVVGGAANQCQGNNSVVIGGDTNVISSTTDNNAIIGGDTNTISSSTYGNNAIIGGLNNTISAVGGMNVILSSEGATISGSDAGGNTILSSAIGSASINGISANNLVVGVNNMNNCINCFTAGSSNSLSSVTGAFVIGEGIVASTPYQFHARYFAGTDAYYFETTVGGGVGVKMDLGSTAWASISDRNMKENFEDIDHIKLVKTVVSKIPIQKWSYKNADDKFIGPIAQDWWEALHIGQKSSAGTHIDTINPAGVALGCVHGLNKMIENLESVISTQNIKIKDLEEKVSLMNSLLEKIILGSEHKSS